MNIIKVAAWSELVSSIAVLATLVYLTIQVQQNTTALRAQTHHAMFDGDRDMLATLVNNPEIVRDYLSEEELTPDRKIRLHVHLVGLMRSREFQWLQYQNGVLDEATWASYKNVIPISLGPKRNRQWWAAIGHRAYNPAFVDEVNTLLDDRPDPQTWEQVLALK